MVDLRVGYVIPNPSAAAFMLSNEYSVPSKVSMMRIERAFGLLPPDSFSEIAFLCSSEMVFPL